MLALQKFFPCPGGTITFSSLIIFGISETRLVSFDAVLSMIRGSSLKHYFSVICIFSHFFPIRNNCFDNALIFTLNFINVRKSEHFPNWEILCGRNIFMSFIIRFQISKGLVYSVWTNWFKIHMAPAFKIPFSINPWKLLTLAKYCIYLQLLWERYIQMLPLIIENSPFPCIIAIFLSKTI